MEIYVGEGEALACSQAISIQQKSQSYLGWKNYF